MLRHSDAAEIVGRSKSDSVSGSCISDCDSGFHEPGVLTAPFVRASNQQDTKNNHASSTSRLKKSSKPLPAPRTQSAANLETSSFSGSVSGRLGSSEERIPPKRESLSSLGAAEEVVPLISSRSSTSSSIADEPSDKFTRQRNKEYERSQKIRGYSRHGERFVPTVREATVSKSAQLIETTERRRRPKPRSKSADPNRRAHSKSVFSPFYSKILSEEEMGKRREWADIIKRDCILEEEYYKVPYEECNREVILGRFSRSEPKLNFNRKFKKKVSFSEDTNGCNDKDQKHEAVRTIKRNNKKGTNLDAISGNGKQLHNCTASSGQENLKSLENKADTEKDQNSNLQSLIQLIREIKTPPDKESYGHQISGEPERKILEANVKDQKRADILQLTGKDSTTPEIIETYLDKPSTPRPQSLKGNPISSTYEEGPSHKKSENSQNASEVATNQSELRGCNAPLSIKDKCNAKYSQPKNPIIPLHLDQIHDNNSVLISPSLVNHAMAMSANNSSNVCAEKQLSNLQDSKSNDRFSSKKYQACDALAVSENCLGNTPQTNSKPTHSFQSKLDDAEVTHLQNCYQEDLSNSKNLSSPIGNPETLDMAIGKTSPNIKKKNKLKTKKGEAMKALKIEALQGTNLKDFTGSYSPIELAESKNKATNQAGQNVCINLTHGKKISPKKQLLHYNQAIINRALKEREISRKRQTTQKARNLTDYQKANSLPRVKNDCVNIFMRQNANFTDHQIQLTTCVNSLNPNVVVSRVRVPFSSIRDQWLWAKHFWPLPSMADHNGSPFLSNGKNSCGDESPTLSDVTAVSPVISEDFSSEENCQLYSKDGSFITKDVVASPTPSCCSSSSGSSTSGCFSASCSPSPMPTTLRVFPLPTPL